MMINLTENGFNVDQPSKRLAACWGILQDLVLSASAKTVSEVSFQENVSEKELIFGYLFLTDILVKYVCFIYCFLRK